MQEEDKSFKKLLTDRVRFVNGMPVYKRAENLAVQPLVKRFCAEEPELSANAGGLGSAELNAAQALEACAFKSCRTCVDWSIDRNHADLPAG